MTGRTSLVALLVAGLCFGLLGAPGSAIAEELELTPRQRTRLDQGKVVLTRVDDPSERGDAAGELIGLMRATVSDAAIWSAIMDFEAIAEETPGLRSASVVEDAAPAFDGRTVVAYELVVFDKTIRYQLVHWLDPARRTIRWSLDPDASHDLGQLDGVIALSGEAGQTTIRYSSVVDTGMRIPRWVEDWLVGTSLKGYLRSLRDRAQASTIEGNSGRGPTTAPSASSSSSP